MECKYSRLSIQLTFGYILYLPFREKYLKM